MSNKIATAQARFGLQNSRFARALSKVHQSGKPREVVSKLVTELLSQLGSDGPVSPFVIAKNLSLPVQEVDIEAEGVFLTGGTLAALRRKEETADGQTSISF